MYAPPTQDGYTVQLVYSTTLFTFIRLCLALGKHHLKRRAVELGPGLPKREIRRQPAQRVRALGRRPIAAGGHEYPLGHLIDIWLAVGRVGHQAAAGANGLEPQAGDKAL